MTDEKNEQPLFLTRLMEQVDKALRDVPPQVFFEAMLKKVTDDLEKLSKPAPNADSPYDKPAEYVSPEQPKTAPRESQLPTLQAGIWRHYKGGLYNVLGYAHDANPPSPSGRRDVVVYVPLYTTPEQLGPRMAVRSVGDFFAKVCTDSGKPLGRCSVHLDSRACRLADRFTYQGPEYLGD